MPVVIFHQEHQVFLLQYRYYLLSRANSEHQGFDPQYHQGDFHHLRECHPNRWREDNPVVSSWPVNHLNLVTYLRDKEVKGQMGLVILESIFPLLLSEYPNVRKWCQFHMLSDQ